MWSAHAKAYFKGNEIKRNQSNAGLNRRLNFELTCLSNIPLFLPWKHRLSLTKFFNWVSKAKPLLAARDIHSLEI